MLQKRLIGIFIALLGIIVTGMAGYATEGVIVVALRDRREDSYLFNPSRKTLLNENHIMIVMGNVDRINEIRAEPEPSKMP